MVSQIPGYIYGSRELPQAPVSDEEFKLLKSTVLMTDEDVRYLRMAGEVLKDQVEDVLDLWYGWVGSNKHLVYYFGDRETGQPIGSTCQRSGRGLGNGFSTHALESTTGSGLTTSTRSDAAITVRRRIRRIRWTR